MAVTLPRLKSHVVQPKVLKSIPQRPALPYFSRLLTGADFANSDERHSGSMWLEVSALSAHPVWHAGQDTREGGWGQ